MRLASRTLPIAGLESYAELTIMPRIKQWNQPSPQAIKAGLGRLI